MVEAIENVTEKKQSFAHCKRLSEFCIIFSIIFLALKQVFSSSGVVLCTI